jgi:hypothetical protein
MTPDELPADMEAVVARLSYPDPGFDYEGQLVDRKDIHALLKAYQEQRRALERIGNALEAVRYVPGDHPVVPIKHDAFVKTVDAALNQKGDER